MNPLTEHLQRTDLPKPVRQDSPAEQDVPGAYPNSPSAPGVIETIKTYIPAQTDIQSAITTVGQTAKAYLPEAVHGYIPGAATNVSGSELPSSEAPSGSSGGVGSLPGDILEDGVAKLPQERAHDGFPTKETPSGASVGVGSLPGNIFEEGVAKLPEERIQDDRKDVQRSQTGGNTSTPHTGLGLPSTTHSTSAPHGAQTLPSPSLASAINTKLPAASGTTPQSTSRGVGDLPGPASEAGVAILPTERRGNAIDDDGILPKPTATISTGHDDRHHHDNKDIAAGRIPDADIAALKDVKYSLKEIRPAHQQHDDHSHDNTSSIPHTSALGATDRSTALNNDAAHVHQQHDNHPHDNTSSITHTSALGATDRPAASNNDARIHQQHDDHSRNGASSIPHTSALGTTEHSATSNSDDAHVHHEPANPVKTPHSDSHSTSESSSTRDDSPSRSKPGLLAKLKGEAKVLTGKLSRNEEKVQEGKRLKEEGY